MMTPIAAALFDFDGTLVDSMPIHYEAYRRVLADVGIDLSHADFYENVGGAARDTIPKFLRGRPCAVGVDEIHARKKRVVSALLESEPLVALETAKLVPVLKSSFRVALVSSGARPGIEIMLRRLGWADWFDVVVTGEDTPRSKPAPDPFLLAAEKLGVASPTCIVFEDTDDGVAAARAAGMSVFDVRRTIARVGSAAT